MICFAVMIWQIICSETRQAHLFCWLSDYMDSYFLPEQKLKVTYLCPIIRHIFLTSILHVHCYHSNASPSWSTFDYLSSFIASAVMCLLPHLFIIFKTMLIWVSFPTKIDVSEVIVTIRILSNLSNLWQLRAAGRGRDSILQGWTLCWLTEC